MSSLWSLYNFFMPGEEAIFMPFSCGGMIWDCLGASTYDIKLFMLRCVRTTLSLDDDVAALLARVRKARKTGLKQIVNEALRSGLRVMVAPPPRRSPFHTTPVALGRCHLPELDDVSGAITFLEGEQHK
jgi:hypothetical protein